MEKNHACETGIIASGQTDSLEVMVLGKDRWEEIRRLQAQGRVGRQHTTVTVAVGGAVAAPGRTAGGRSTAAGGCGTLERRQVG